MQINVKKVLFTIDHILQELKQGIEPEKLSSADKKEIRNEIAGIKALVFKIKLKLAS